MLTSAVICKTPRSFLLRNKQCTSPGSNSPEEKKQISGATMPSVGVHNLWVSAELVRQVFEGQCPGVSLVNPRVQALDNSEGTLGEAMVQRWKQEALPWTVAYVSLTLMAKIFGEESITAPVLVDFLREAEET
ncbi:unnamed protein product [Symbiodinium microadriaticum]|nr:unnamed protein product [Symbiodinium microadriaticum]CAE7886407.1 unnamed protein product [Symbiodinium sp. KB8]